MKPSVTPFDDLAWFLAVATAGSIAEAAKRLGTDPSTVSRRISRLEDRLERTLFVRSARGAELSDAGRLLARRVQTAMNEVELGLDELTRSPIHLSGTVRIAAPTEIGSAFLVPFLPSFAHTHPQVVIELLLGAAVLDLERREADIAVRTFRPTQGDVVTRRLAATLFAPFHARSLSTEQARLRWLTWLEDDAYVASVLKRTPDARVVLRSNDLAGLRSACCVGLGCALLPLQLGEVHDLVRLEGAEAFESPPLWIAAPRTSLEMPRVRAVWDTLIDRFDA